MSSPPAEATPQLVLGTAGHIDHGKTALVRALTGVDTDRLPEERSRGITIELGFAPLDLGEGLRLGVVDVPGHERLVRTMVAGASGIDLVLLVVAADEGVMPQTREHVAICDLLGIRHGVVALTKADLADETMLELAREEVEGLLAETSLAEAPLLATSAASGAGLEELRAALRELARRAAARTAREGPPRLSIDRAFAMRGFGTVVTGTLVGSALRVGDPVMLLPSGRRARIRGLQRHGVKLECVEPGARCAVNLQGIEVSEVARGEVLTRPEALPLTRSFDAELRWLAGSPPVVGECAVELVAGTAERRARLGLIGGGRLLPGGTGYARIHLEGAPLALLPGDRFVLRGFARTELGGTTLGGGRVIDVAPPHRRRSDPALRLDLELLARREPELELSVRVRRAGLAGMPLERLRLETGLPEARFEAALGTLEGRGELFRGRAGSLLSREALDDVVARLTRALDDFHAGAPLEPGMPPGALRGALPRNLPEDAFELALGRAEEAGLVALEGDRVRRSTHRVALAGADTALAERVLERARKAGLEPPTLKEWAQELDAPLERTRALLTHLERQGRLVRAPGELWFDRGAIDALRERIVARLAGGDAIETPEYKALIGTTRKHAVPLMELFDAERLTLRVGNRRRLRGASGKG